MMRVAIVDDSTSARLFIRRCMEIVGFSEALFIEAGNGREALEIIRHAPVDLLITDLVMPVMDGQTLLKWMKSSPVLCDIPVLVISSAGNPAKEAELHELGAYGVLRKPVSPPALHSLLEAFLAQRKTADA